jgi:hypothetical protein
MFVAVLIMHHVHKNGFYTIIKATITFSFYCWWFSVLKYWKHLIVERNGNQSL